MSIHGTYFFFAGLNRWTEIFHFLIQQNYFGKVYRLTARIPIVDNCVSQKQKFSKNFQRSFTKKKMFENSLQIFGESEISELFLYDRKMATLNFHLSFTTKITISRSNFTIMFNSNNKKEEDLKKKKLKKKSKNKKSINENIYFLKKKGR